MKKIYFLLAVTFGLFTANAQTLTNGSFEGWTDGSPDGWMGTKSNISASSVLESTDAQDGSKSVELLNAASGHKRFTSQPIDLEAETTYTLTYYTKGTGEVRNAFFNGNPESSGSGYSSYSAYTTATGDWTEVEYIFTTDAENFTGVEVIFSLRNTGETEGLLIDNAILSSGGEIEIIQVADVATLRAGVQDGTFYELTGEAILTFQQANRNQKYIQDDTAGILIDDAAGRITGTYAVGDGITGIIGTLGTYNGLIQFIPSEDAPTASSTGNTVTPEMVSLADYLANPTDYESELIQINALTIADADGGDGTFQTGKNYTMTGTDGEVIGRTQFYEIPLIGTDIPTTTSLVTGFGSRFNDTFQMYLLEVEDALGVNDMNLAAVNMTTVWNTQATIAVNGKATVEIFNLNGQLVQKATGNNTFNVNVSGLAKGVYIVKVTVDGKTSVQKVVKK